MGFCDRTRSRRGAFARNANICSYFWSNCIIQRIPQIELYSPLLTLAPNIRDFIKGSTLLALNKSEVLPAVFLAFILLDLGPLNVLD